LYRRSLVTAVAAAALSLACGGDGSGPSPDSFAGTWDATKYEFTNVANTSEKVDVIALGATLVVVLNADETYEATATPPGGAPEVTTGTWHASSDVFTIRETGISGEMQFDYHRSGNTLTLSGASDEFDFDGDDQTPPEAARVSAVLVRR
jgi:hypothetical protein